MTISNLYILYFFIYLFIYLFIFFLVTKSISKNLLVHCNCHNKRWLFNSPWAPSNLWPWRRLICRSWALFIIPPEFWLLTICRLHELFSLCLCHLLGCTALVCWVKVHVGVEQGQPRVKLLRTSDQSVLHYWGQLRSTTSIA